MTTELSNFKSWYADVLLTLYPIRNAGIAALMLSFPLLERYLRQKNNLNPSDALNDGCMTDLCTIFPALPSLGIARQFWHIYRNGFLHQVTLSPQKRNGTNMPVGWLTHDINTAVSIEADGSFLVQPVLFSQTVVKTIENNFLLFAGIGTPAPPLPVVESRLGASIPGSTQSVILSTRGGSGPPR